MKNIKFDDLHHGDVLLCRGEGWLSDLIVLFDGGIYSHAALYAGKEDNIHYVIHATKKGMLKMELALLSSETFTDVFRFNKNSHKLGDEGYPYEPVISIGQHYVDEKTKYAFDHLILLALLGITRKIPLDVTSKKIMRSILDNATAYIFEMLDKGTTPMVCSELVYRCFDEADLEKKYQLGIETLTIEDLKDTLKKEVLKIKDSDEIAQELDKELMEAKEKFVEAWSKVKQGENTIHGLPLDPASACVTPKDLEKSPDLQKIGRLQF
ncbi:hypothetical protein CACET_c28520 [Clostridium aceticum]|uniref:Uncharacterized protein n=1 Tax=Clostridium aceticum TaxID=84022 RepID=A0A0D8ICH8_9CLOT|nr:hypothetical protein [Clostridium aceticum]AKL96297.1 hypothetical protein CACET_c28520 [Clostridium aceticum]KJF26896.1 hypothetical protein TZ02_10160 [Clostridium aceticum]